MNSTSASGRETWEVPQCPYQIQYEVSVLQRIARDVFEGFQALPYGGLEVGGLLLGTVEEDSLIQITGYAPLPCEHASGPSFLLSENDKANLAANVEKFASREDKQVVGWYHSHTRSALTFTPEDVNVHNKFFGKASNVALVLTPCANGLVRGGFFCKEGNGATMRTSSSYKEFEITPEGLDRSLPRPMLRTQGQGNGAGTAVALARQTVIDRPKTAMVPYERPVERPAVNLNASRSRWPVWAVLGAMFLAAIGGVVYLRNFYAPPAQSAASKFLKVEAVHKNGNITISWDPAAVANAKQGQIDIQDGPIKARLMLDERTLSTGSVSYAYKSDVTGFNVRVEKNDGTSLEGSTTYVASGGAGTPTPVPAPVKTEAAKMVEPPKPVPVKTEVAKALEPPKPERPKEVAKVETPKPEPAKTEPPKIVAKTEPPKPVETPKPRAETPAPKPVEVAVSRPPAAPPVQQQPVQTPPPQPQVQQPTPPQPAPQSTAAAATQTAQRAANPAPAASTPTVTRTTPPPSRPAPPPPMQLGGRWVLSPGSASRSPSTPESVVINAKDADGTISGSLTAKYKGGKPQQLNFSGKMVNGMARFSFTAKDGSKGSIEFLRVPGISDMAEVVWYGDSGAAYDHIIRKVN